MGLLFNISMDNFDFNVGRRGEIVHTNHKLEFFRFFNRHKRLCDEISGLKSVGVGDGKEIVITRYNFVLGIRLLDSFITEFLPYVYVVDKANLIRDRFDKLEHSFINDEDYTNFVSKGDSINVTNDVLFSKKYILYLRECFEISFTLSKFLQSSLNISSKEIVKNLSFVSYEAFFNNLSVYKEEVASVLSNSDFSNLFTCYKKMLGFFYTYRYLVAIREQKHIIFLFNSIYDYIILDENIKLLGKFKDGVINGGNVKDLRNEFFTIRRGFNLIFDLIIKSLQLKNILPKATSEVLVDTSLI